MLFLLACFFVIALLYSSAGFGGGSSYTAILSMTGLDHSYIPLVSLTCNLVVVSGGSYFFWKHKQIQWKKLLPLVSVSIPAAFLGGLYQVPKEQFFLLLGLSLCVAGVFMLFQWNTEKERQFMQKPIINIAVGFGLGLLSGMVGIGGGIYLSPLLHLSGWGKPKQIAAAASFFILVNSVAGLMGQLLKFHSLPYANFPTWPFLWLPFAVLIGGQIGSRLSHSLFSPKKIKGITAFLVLVAGLKLLSKVF